MNSLASADTSGFFWLALAFVVMAIVWLMVKKQQMKHELILKLLDKGKEVDQALLDKLLATDKPAAVQPKPLSEQHLDGGSFMTLLFVVPGMIMMAVALLGDAGPNWPLFGLGVFSFLFGNLCWHGAYKRYLVEKAEEKADAAQSPH